jgi:hypothetical protein
MKKLAALFLAVALSLGLSIPAEARRPKTQNKYKGLDKASRRAQKKEQRQMDRYAKAQHKAERRNLKRQKKSTYKPIHSSH